MSSRTIFGKKKKEEKKKGDKKIIISDPKFGGSTWMMTSENSPGTPSQPLATTKNPAANSSVGSPQPQGAKPMQQQQNLAQIHASSSAGPFELYGSSVEPQSSVHSSIPGIGLSPAPAGYINQNMTYESYQNYVSAVTNSSLALQRSRQSQQPQQFQQLFYQANQPYQHSSFGGTGEVHPSNVPSQSYQTISSTFHSSSVALQPSANSNPSVTALRPLPRPHNTSTAAVARRRDHQTLPPISDRNYKIHQGTYLSSGSSSCSSCSSCSSDNSNGHRG